MSGSQVPEGTIVHRAWVVRGEVVGVAQRWGAVVMTVLGDERGRCHTCWDDPGHGILSSRTRGDALKLVEKAQAKALKFSAAMGDLPIRRFCGGNIQTFQDWFRGKEGDILTSPSDDHLEELRESLG